MKHRILARLLLVTAFTFSMGTLSAGSPEDCPDGRVDCCKKCPEGGCPLRDGGKEGDDGSSARGDQDAKPCERPCPKEKQGASGEREGA